jgi:molybdopterin-synthase adenylyltransferase
LARAGVGRLTLLDRDIVETSNLQRQSLFDERDAAERLPKAEAARRRLAAVNSEIALHAIVNDLTARNAERIIAGVLGMQEHAAEAGPPGSDEPLVIADGTDNFETRFLLNDLAVKHGFAYAYAGVVGTRGTIMLIEPGKGPCLRCLGDDPGGGNSETCDVVGVWGPVVAATTAIQAAGLLRYLISGAAEKTLVEIDLWPDSGISGTRSLDVSQMGPRSDCVCCGLKRFDSFDTRAAGTTVSLCGQNAVQVTPVRDEPLDLIALEQRLRAIASVERNAFLLRFRPESAEELTIFSDGRAIVKGTSDAGRARSLYARYVGA